MGINVRYKLISSHVLEILALMFVACQLIAIYDWNTMVIMLYCVRKGGLHKSHNGVKGRVGWTSWLQRAVL